MESTAEFRQKLMERYGKEHLSYSSIKHALGDMRYFDMYMKGETKKTSDALTFGSMYDMFLFEPDKAKEHYYILNPDDIIKQLSEKAQGGKNPKATAEYKAKLAELELEVSDNGQEIVTIDDYESAMKMIQRLRDSGLYSHYLEGNKFQVEMLEEIDGILIKGYIDCLAPHMVIDSKSTRSMSKFRYDVNSFCYDIQAYLYTRGTGIDEFYWLVQEKSYPYYPGIVRCSQETLFNGEMKFNEAIGNIATFLNKGEDYDYSKHFAEFSV